MRYDGKWVTVVLVGILLVMGLAWMGFYGHFMYDDWRCGMPNVECKEVVR